MIELGKLFMPRMIDYTTRGTITLRRPEFHSEEYFEDSECSLHLRFFGETIYIDYFSEDEVYLSELLGYDHGHLAAGDLTEEKFEAIQNRAMKVLYENIDEAQQEMLEYFDDLI